MILVCSHCGASERWPTLRWPCPCGGPRELSDLPAFDPQAIDPHQPGLWRYRALLPRCDSPVTLGEGFTPLLAGGWPGADVRWKLEGLNPTGSFKDRYAALVVSDIVAQGAREVVEDSSGNAGASLAAYAARAGLRARIFAPAHASPVKLAQIAVYGAELVPVPGPRSEATRAAEAAVAQGAIYASHVWHPLAIVGTATIAWEIWEQLDGRAPDWFVSPVGQGTLLLGAWRGFQGLYAAGLIGRLPRLVAAQAERCAPLARALAEGAMEAEAVPSLSTVAEGIAIVRPVRSRALLQAIRESHGLVLVASEEQILAAQVQLAQRGLYVEPTSATAAAVLPQIEPYLLPGETIVVALTGSGLKSPSFPNPPVG